MASSQVKSRQRVADHGEVFTAEREVNAMLDLVAQETQRVDSRFLEPACGDGNFLAEILRRKLAAARRMAVPPRRKKIVVDEYERQSIIAVSSCYGVEILMDNVIACRRRLFAIWDDEYKAVCQGGADEEVVKSVRFILERNIVCADALSYRKVDSEGKVTGEPIVFSEWTFITGDMMQRKDFQFDKMVNGGYEPAAGGKDSTASPQMSLWDTQEDEGELLCTYIADYRRIWCHES